MDSVTQRTSGASERPILPTTGSSSSNSSSTFAQTSSRSSTTPPELIIASSSTSASSSNTRSMKVPAVRAFSPPRTKKPVTRKSHRPATAPSTDNRSRTPLLPAQPTSQTSLKSKSDDERLVVGYSISRGRSPGQSDDLPVSPSSELLRHPTGGVSTRSGHLASTVQLHNALEETVMDGITTDHSNTTAAATVRWAGAGVDVAPLALPSPEFELTDPMRRASRGAASSTPPPTAKLDRSQLGTKYDRMGHTAWEGLPSSAPVRVKPSSDRPGYFAARQSTSRLEAITGSPVGSPGERSSIDVDIPTVAAPSEPPSPSAKRKSREGILFHPASSPWGSPGSSASSYRSFHTAYNPQTSASATAPPHRLPDDHNDYFGHIPFKDGDGARGKAASSQARTPDGRRGSVESCMLPSVGNDSSMEISPYTLMAIPPNDPRDSLQLGMASSGTSDPYEAWFSRMGYLLSPPPSDELERRKALYKFNVLYTARDLNFDRIAHLAKLVFNTKIVAISLLDEKQQWHKSETGAGLAIVDRAYSFCSHSILQRSDEPLVILDATKDWRFAKNPLVVGKPHIRFYAGAPLRTQDGHNIGSLCIIDDEPKQECSPRTRHALKEFASIVMRELELWRDKIQLRIRDRIQTSMERFTRECLEMDVPPDGERRNTEASMQKVYQEATTLVKKTLDVDGALVLDVSHFEAAETLDSQGKRKMFYHGDLFEATPTGLSGEHSPRGGPLERRPEFTPIPALPILGADEETSNPLRGQPFSGEEHAKLSKFLSTCPEGKIYERLPSCFRRLMPQNIQYAMIVPVFNVDKRPFLLLCAYTTKGTMHFLEGFELQYLRAVGVIILSAVLKRRMILADTAKSLFISNISHELRTPLHGILASAELLHDTRLTNTQDSYLKTVQGCAQSLVETVNHVLDFTKLSGNAREGGKQHPIKLSKLDLKHLIEETVEGCWLGAQARAASAAEEIGSVYSPPPHHQPNSPETLRSERQAPSVETVIDIALREEGWWVVSDRGGIRRILMNLVGNSIKFTKDGFIQVRLRELPQDVGTGKAMIEIAVFDSGKGISKDFLQHRLFQPFSQENPLQTGTGLGLAIVNSIGTSLGGKVDVWSAEGAGTEIRLTMQVDLAQKQRPLPIAVPKDSLSVSLHGFDADHKGVKLLRDVMVGYLTEWWGFRIAEDFSNGDILIVNGNLDVISDLTTSRDFSRPVLLLSMARGDTGVMHVVNAFERLGGLCRIIFKPNGPVRLEEALRTAVSKLEVLRGSPASSSVERNSQSFRTAPDTSSDIDSDADPAPVSVSRDESLNSPSVPPMSSLTRRRSEEPPERTPRPSLGQRSSTYTGSSSLRSQRVGAFLATPENEAEDGASTSISNTPGSTVVIGEDGSVMLRSAVGTTGSRHKPVVLLVDDNAVNRNLLAHWLKKRGHTFLQACDGQEAVDIFNQQPPGYFDLIKPVAFKTLDGVFERLQHG
ncbi:His Kinase A domain containing protein [Tulasnella sp. 403]|nr:His Kinase A domain containing protein [Tulasnella sp. 403]